MTVRPPAVLLRRGSRTPVRRAGFTLLELLVVLAIVAVISGAAVLGMSAIGRDLPRQQAQRLALVWDSLCREAAVDARILGLQLGAREYAAVQPARESLWRPAPGALYGPHQLPEGMRLRIEGIPADEQPGSERMPKPQVLCLPGGANAPRALLLDVAGQPRFRIALDPREQRHLAEELP